jgi:hypothetical protein
VPFAPYLCLFWGVVDSTLRVLDTPSRTFRIIKRQEPPAVLLLLTVEAASALPAAAGAYSGLLWLMYYIPRRTAPERGSGGIGRNYAWISVAVGLLLVFIFVLGRGIRLRF